MNVVLKTLQIFLSWPLTFKNASIHPPSFRPEVHGQHTRLSIQLYCLAESHQQHVTLEKPLFPHVWLRVAICALQNERERNNFYLVELFLRRLLSPKHHYYNPKTEPGKSKRSYKKALISESSLWAWTLLRLSSLLYDCGQWASCEPWLICSCWENTGFHMTPSTALHCTALHCPAQSCWNVLDWTPLRSQGGMDCFLPLPFIIGFFLLLVLCVIHLVSPADLCSHFWRNLFCPQSEGNEP